MKLPRKMEMILKEATPEFRRLFQQAYERVEGLNLSFHPQNSPNVIARHPSKGVNFVALWIKGKKGEPRIEGEVRIDGCLVDLLSTDMENDLTIHKYDRGKKPLWWVTRIDDIADIERMCTIVDRVKVRNPPWGNR